MKGGRPTTHSIKTNKVSSPVMRCTKTTQVEAIPSPVAVTAPVLVEKEKTKGVLCNRKDEMEEVVVRRDDTRRGVESCLRKIS